MMVTLGVMNTMMETLGVMNTMMGGGVDDAADLQGAEA
jgi:hypothetical protein